MTKFKLVALCSTLSSVLLLASCVGGKDMKQEQQSVKAQFEQLAAVNESRKALLAGLEDQALARLLWQEQHANYFTMLNLIPFHMGPGEFQYTQPWLLRLPDYADFAKLTDTYKQSLLAMSDYENSECMNYAGGKGFKLHEGFAFPFRHYLHFSQITFEDGRTLALPDAANNERATADIAQVSSGYCFTSPVTAESPQPATVQGELDIELPTALLEFKFTAADVGKTAEQDGYLVTLLEFENGRYVIEVDAKENVPLNFGNRDILAEAVDSHGQYLAWRATERTSTRNPQRIDALLESLYQRAEQGTLDETEARNELTALRDTLRAEQGRKLFLGRAFNGVVEQAHITLMVYASDSQPVSHKLELPVHNFPHPQRVDDGNLQLLPKIPLTAPVYSTLAEHRLPIVELDKAAMQQRVSMVQWHEAGEGLDPEREHSGQIGWFYPPVQTDIFMSQQDRAGSIYVLATFDFYDAQGKQVVAREANEQESELVAFEYKPADKGLSSVYSRMFGRLEYSPERFTNTPVRVKGSLPVLVAPNLNKQSYTTDNLPKGIRLTSNQLVIDYAVFTPLEVAEVSDNRTERRNQVFAKDEHGYLVEMVKQTYFHHQPKRTPVDVYYFYGKPETIEIWYRGKLAPVDYEFDIELVNDGIQVQ
ncbi:hypothetical protein ABC502_12315 [Alkalimonas sp. NCh-2]|uniref:hypothetical protein n=1 Tax=Alkalimonas sp. NCh-2 TaxID=3144846 RepID=UPI0031F6EC5B